MSERQSSNLRQTHWLGMAGLSRNVGFAANKVFAANLLQVILPAPFLIGLILGLEGFFGLVLNPLTGYWSDRTRRPWLRRKVYVMVCLPIAAVAWWTFCSVHHVFFAVLALAIFYAFEQSSLSPYQAWMPEITPLEQRGIASGYLNFWWQIGNLFSFLVIPILWEMNHSVAYLLTGVLIAAGGLLTGLFVIERPERVVREKPSLRSYRPLLFGNLRYFFLFQCLSWIAFEAIASFFTLFTVKDLHGTVLDSGLIMSVFTAVVVVVSLLSGALYRRVSPKWLLVVAAIGFGILVVLGYSVQTVPQAFLLVGVAGVFWSLNMTVSYAFVSDLLRRAVSDELAANQLSGGLYGMSNLVQSVALLLAAPIVGAFIRLFGDDYRAMFATSAVASFAAALVILAVTVPRVSERVEENIADVI
ncbi:MAG: MFS transporter [Alicyclobacillaceae bacterium]|nr:MFS transporter [Alicyclobacillaceae bacterium]